MIKIPIEIGDIVRVGRFKNKRVKVKSIEYDVYGLPIINGRPLLTMRIEKLMEPKQESIIKLTEILKEIEIGNVPFADETDKSIEKIIYLVDLLKDYGKEDNTKSESDFLADLKKYFNTPSRDNLTSTIDIADLKQLLKLKSKFPSILSPVAEGHDYAFRGMTIPVDYLLNNPEGSSGNRFEGEKLRFAVPKGTKIKSLSKRPFLSFSLSARTAYNFSDVVSQDPTNNAQYWLNSGKLPGLVAVDINDPNFLFSYKFTRSISHWDEDEIIYVGNEPTIEYVEISKNSLLKIVNYLSNRMGADEFSKYPKFYKLVNKYHS